MAFIFEKKENNVMGKNTYKIISKFECCGVDMVTVIMDGKAACVMPEVEFNRIIEEEWKYNRQVLLRVA